MEKLNIHEFVGQVIKNKEDNVKELLIEFKEWHVKFRYASANFNTSLTYWMSAFVDWQIYTKESKSIVYLD